MIVWVASYPRSGNRFARTLLQRCFRMEIGTLYSRHEGAGTRHLSEVYLDNDPDRIEEAKASDDLLFVKTHELAEAGDDSPALYLVRDGRDAITSYARFAVAQRAAGFEERTFEEAAEVLMLQQDPRMGSWSANVRSWTRRAAPTAIIRFEQLTREPIGVLRAASSSLGIELPDDPDDPPTFDQLQKTESAVLFRRGKIGAWSSELPAELERRFWSIHGGEMISLGYSRGHPAPADVSIG
jgi:hypothetical protein